jgi:hypothetical protein
MPALIADAVCVAVVVLIFFSVTLTPMLPPIPIDVLLRAIAEMVRSDLAAAATVTVFVEVTHPTGAAEFIQLEYTKLK